PAARPESPSGPAVDPVTRAPPLRIVMAKRRGRPPGTSGRAAVLSASQVRHVFRVARSRSRHAARAEAALAMSLGLGLRAKELTSLKWDDVYDAEGSVRPVLPLRAAYTKGRGASDVLLTLICRETCRT